MILTEGISGLTLTSVLDKQRSTDPNSIAKAQKEEFISKNKFDVNNTENISIVYDPESRTCEITGNVVSNHLVYEDTQEKTEDTPEYYEIKLSFSNVDIKKSETDLNSENDNKLHDEESDDKSSERDNNQEKENRTTSDRIDVIIDIDKMPAKVRCSCQHYRFYYSEANKDKGFMTGESFPPYETKTNSHRSPRNPERHSGMCKHLIFFITQILDRVIISDDKRFNIKCISGQNNWNSFLNSIKLDSINRPKYKHTYRPVVKSPEEIHQAEIRRANNKLNRIDLDTATYKRRGRPSNKSDIRKPTASTDIKDDSNYVDEVFYIKNFLRKLISKDEINKNKSDESLNISNLVTYCKNKNIIDKNANIKTLNDLKKSIDQIYDYEATQLLRKKAAKIFDSMAVSETDDNKQKREEFINIYVNNHKKYYNKYASHLYIPTRNIARYFKDKSYTASVYKDSDYDKVDLGLIRHRYTRQLATEDEGIKNWFNDKLSEIKNKYKDHKSSDYKYEVRKLELDRGVKIKKKYDEIKADLIKKASQKNLSLNDYVYNLINKNTTINYNSLAKSYIPDEDKVEKDDDTIQKEFDKAKKDKEDLEIKLDAIKTKLKTDSNNEDLKNELVQINKSRQSVTLVYNKAKKQYEKRFGKIETDVDVDDKNSYKQQQDNKDNYQQYEQHKKDILEKWKPLNDKREDLIIKRSLKTITSKEEEELENTISKMLKLEDEYYNLTGGIFIPDGIYYERKKAQKNREKRYMKAVAEPKKKTTVKSTSNQNKTQKKVDDNGETQQASNKRITAQRVTRPQRQPKPKAADTKIEINLGGKSIGRVYKSDGVPIIPEKPVLSGKRGDKQKAYNYIQALVEYNKYLKSKLSRTESYIKELDTKMNSIEDKESEEYNSIKQKHDSLELERNKMKKEYEDRDKQIDSDIKDLGVDWEQLYLGED